MVSLERSEGSRLQDFSSFIKSSSQSHPINHWRNQSMGRPDRTHVTIRMDISSLQGSASPKPLPPRGHVPFRAARSLCSQSCQHGSDGLTIDSDNCFEFLFTCGTKGVGDARQQGGVQARRVTQLVRQPAGVPSGRSLCESQK